jgi:hypothetical protein
LATLATEKAPPQSKPERIAQPISFLIQEILGWGVRQDEMGLQAFDGATASQGCDAGVIYWAGRWKTARWS